jgi:hypothetical protein
MSKNIILVLVYHRHKLLDLIYVRKGLQVVLALFSAFASKADEMLKRDREVKAKIKIVKCYSSYCVIQMSEQGTKNLPFNIRPNRYCTDHAGLLFSRKEMLILTECGNVKQK